MEPWDDYDSCDPGTCTANGPAEAAGMTGAPKEMGRTFSQGMELPALGGLGPVGAPRGFEVNEGTSSATYAELDGVGTLVATVPMPAPFADPAPESPTEADHDQPATP